MSLKIDMLRSFCAVARSGNLADAAHTLGRTPSALSMTLKQLEKHLGQSLFESDRKSRLTPLGARVYAMAQTQLRQYDNTVRAIETAAQAPRGLVRIAAVPSVAAVVFPQVIADMMQRRPGLKVEMRDADTASVLDALVQGRVDVGAVSGEHRVRGVRRTTLFSDAFGMVCRSDHPLAQRLTPPDFDDLARAGFIFHNLCNLIRTRTFIEMFADSDIRVHNTVSLLAMVRASNRVTILPENVMMTLPEGMAFRRVTDLPDRRIVSAMVREDTAFADLIAEFESRLHAYDWSKTRPSY